MTSHGQRNPLVRDAQTLELLPDVCAGVVLLEIQLWPLMNMAAYGQHPGLNCLSLMTPEPSQ